MKLMLKKTMIRAAICLTALAVFSCIPGMSAIYAADSDGLPQNSIHNVTKDTTHDTLAEAFSSADSGNVLELTGDIVVDDSASVDKNIILNLQGYTVTSKLSSGSMINISSGSLAVSGGGGAIVSGQSGARAFSNGSGGTLSISDTTVSDFSIKDDGGAIRSEGALTIRGCTFTGNSSTYRYPETTGDRIFHGGGAIFQFRGTLEITDSGFIGNSAAECGGAVHLYYGEGRITGSTFTSNKAETGGALQLVHTAATIENNTIDSNTADNAVSKARGYYHAGKGGGIFAYTMNNKIYLTNNHIKGNKALNTKQNPYTGKGGGITVGTFFNGEVIIKGGVIEENEAEMGGGIDYTIHGMKPLDLNNALVTGNIAIRGGGVWLCPQGSMESYSTLGGTVIYNETYADWETTSKQRTPAVTIYPQGDDIDHEGTDSIDISNELDVGGIRISRRGPGGIRVEWYEDESDDRSDPGSRQYKRYKEGYRVLVSEGRVEGYPDLFGDEDPSGTKLSFGIHSEAPYVTSKEDFLKEAEAGASLIIRNNRALRGGGIAANSPIHMGEKDAKTRELKVKKVWEEGKILKDEIRIDLIRYDTDESGAPLYDENGDLLGKTTLDRDLVLNEANGWSCSFTDLPYLYEDTDHVIRHCDYTVEEVSFVSFEGRVSESSDGDTKTVTLTNYPLTAVSATKVWKDSGTESVRPGTLTFILRKHDPEKGPKSSEDAWQEAELADGRSSRKTVAVAKDGSCSVSWDRLPAGDYRIIEKTDEPAGNGKKLSDVYATEYAQSTVDAEKVVRDAIDEHHRASGRTKKEDWIATLRQEFRDEYIKDHDLDPEHIYHADERDMEAYAEKKIDAFLLELLNSEHMISEVEKATGVRLPAATEDDVRQIGTDEDLVHAFTARIGEITVITNSAEPEEPDKPDRPDDRDKHDGKDDSGDTEKPDAEDDSVRKTTGMDTGDRGIAMPFTMMILSTAGFIAMTIKRRSK